MLFDAAMKWTFLQLPHMMPMWIGMGGDYDTIKPKRMLGSELSNPALAELKGRLLERWKHTTGTTKDHSNL